MQRLRNKKILITGVSKFPANKFVKYFDMQKIPITGVDIRFPVFKPPSLKFYETDSYFSNLEDICKREKIDTVIHLQFDYDIYSEVHPYNRNNYIRFERLLKLRGNNVIRRLFLFSSNYIYGVDLSSEHRFSEDDTLISSSHIAYINDMLIIERSLIDHITPEQGSGLFIFRLAPLYHNFSEDILIRFLKKAVVIYSISGRNPEFQFLYIYDLINCVVNAIVNGNGGVYNVASSDTIRLSDIASHLSKPFVYIPEYIIKSLFISLKWLFKSDIYNNDLINMLLYNSLISIEKSRRDLGYEPQYRSTEIIENITFFD